MSNTNKSKEQKENEYVIKEKDFHFTDEQAHSFLTQIKKINIEVYGSQNFLVSLIASIKK